MSEFPFHSLKEHIDFLEEKKRLVRIKSEVDLQGEVSAISQRANKLNAEAVLMENIRGYPGWRILTNTLGNDEMVAWTVGLSKESWIADIGPKLDIHIPPMEVSSGHCKELKFFGDEVDLTKIPIPFTGDLEGTPCITSAVTNVKEPNTGWQNVAIRRLSLKGKRTLACFIIPVQQDGLILGTYKAMRRKMPIALVIGADPTVYVATQARGLVGVCEYDIWGGITGEPLQVVRAETSDLLVPATAEIVIEGEIDGFEYEYDSPFPDFVGYYSTIVLSSRLEIKAVTMRKDPIYYYLNMGMPPNDGMFLTTEMAVAVCLRELKKKFPGILDMHGAMGGLVLVIKVDKKVAKGMPGFAYCIANFIKCGPFLVVKTIIVVDDDVEDIRDLDQILCTLASKFQATKDVTIIPRTATSAQDPSEPWSAGGFNTSDFMILDCTEPPFPYDEGYKRGKGQPPKRYMEKVADKWHEYGFR